MTKAATGKCMVLLGTGNVVFASQMRNRIENSSNFLDY